MLNIYNLQEIASLINILCINYLKLIIYNIYIIFIWNLLRLMQKKKKYTINYDYYKHNNYYAYLKQFLLNVDDKFNLDVSITSSEIIFKAESVESLDKYNKEKFLKDKYINKFIYDLGSQIMFLKDNNIGILYFSLKDIIIINSNIFLFINPNKLFSISSKDSLQVLSDDKGGVDFIPPELLENTVESKTTWVRKEVGSYYSLAKLILYVFNLVLDDLYYTKLYFFLNRCLESIPKNRKFLYL